MSRLKSFFGTPGSGTKMYEFIRGPLAWACFTIFILGTIFQVVRFFSLTRKTDKVFFTPPPRRGQKNRKISRQTIAACLARLRVSIVGDHPGMVFITLVFHFSIFILPVFLMEHNMLADVLWGISFCPHVLSEMSTDILTAVILACILFFIARRIFIKRVRAISSLYDYYVIGLTTAPFVTGILAVHDIFDYNTLIILHVLSVNMILISIPFTRFAHMIFFFLNRFFIQSEISFGRGSRA